MLSHLALHYKGLIEHSLCAESMGTLRNTLLELSVV